MSSAVLAAPGSIPPSNRLFDDLPPRAPGLLRLRWWALALVLHLVLLLVPASVWQPARDAAPPVTVDVMFERAPAPAAMAPEPVETPAPAETPSPAMEPATEAATNTGVEIGSVTKADTPALNAPERREQAEPSLSETAPAATLRVEELLESVADMDWATPTAAVSIGRPLNSETAERWAKPLLPGVDNALDGTFAPDEVEIVDRWQGPGGVHQVVIRAPNGDTYCGRQEPLNDLRPWLQMPMLFHRCAGGGKRNKGASWRNN